MNIYRWAFIYRYAFDWEKNCGRRPPICIVKQTKRTEEKEKRKTHWSGESNAHQTRPQVNVPTDDTVLILQYSTILISTQFFFFSMLTYEHTQYSCTRCWNSLTRSDNECAAILRFILFVRLLLIIVFIFDISELLNHAHCTCTWCVPCPVFIFFYLLTLPSQCLHSTCILIQWFHLNRYKVAVNYTTTRDHSFIYTSLLLSVHYYLLVKCLCRDWFRLITLCFAIT